VTTAQRLAFVDFQLATVPFLVEIWLVPLKPWCPLQLARLVFWCRWHRVAAVLHGPPESAFPRSAGQRRVDHAKLAAHLCSLRATQRWPPGSAPVLLTGCTPTDLERVKADLGGLPVAEHARLVTCPDSLSAIKAVAAGWRDQFVRAPRQHSALLVRRVRVAMVNAFGRAAAMPGQTAELGEASAHGGAFRKLQNWS
jgi:hypothetical protein